MKNALDVRSLSRHKKKDKDSSKAKGSGNDNLSKNKLTLPDAMKSVITLKGSVTGAEFC